MSETPKAPREWSAVDVFRAVNTGEDIELPAEFVCVTAYAALARENAELRADHEYGLQCNRDLIQALGRCGQEREDALRKLALAREAISKFLAEKYFLTCDLSDCPRTILWLREALEQTK